MTRLRTPLIYLVALAVLAVGTIHYIQNRHSSTSGKGSALPALADAAFPVTLSVYQGLHVAIQGQTLLMGVQSDAPTPVRSIELWDGANRYSSTKPGPGGAATLRWPALSVGEHMLYARALTGTGTSASSDTYRVDVAVAPAMVKGHTPPISVPTLPGETAAQVAARLGVPGADVATPKAGAAQVTPPAMTTVPLTGNAITVAPASATASGLHISVVPHGCDVTVHAAGAPGIDLAVAAPGQPGFVAAKTGTMAGLVPGEHVVMASDAAGHRVMSGFSVPQACVASLGWSGPVTLSGGILTTPKPLNHGYLYLGVDGSPFVRVPADPSAFITVPSSRADLDGMLPSIAGHNLHVQAWEQDGPTAHEVGAGQLTVKNGLNLAAIVGEPSDLFLTGKADTDPGPQKSSITMMADGKVDFGWYAASGRVTAVRWQVLAEPLPTTNYDDHALGLLRTGVSVKEQPPDSGIYLPAHNDEGSFTIDTHDLLRAPSPSDPAGTLLGAIQPPLGTTTLYVRVIGLGNNSSGAIVPLPESSTVVPLTLSTTPTAKPAPINAPPQFAVDKVTVFPGRAPNMDLSDCVIVSGTHWTLNYFGLPKQPLGAFYPHDGRYCLSDFDTSSSCGAFCWIADAVTGVVDFVAKIWDYIATTYVDLLHLIESTIGQYNVICLVLKSAAKNLCDKISTYVVTAVVTAVLAYYGVPSHLPTSSEIAAIAKGDLAEAGKEVLQYLGVPCDDVTVGSDDAAAIAALAKQAGTSVPTEPDGSIDVCKGLIEYGLSVIGTQVKQAGEDSVAAYAGLPPCPIDECTMVPDPDAFARPIAVSMTAHRVGGGPAFANQQLAVIVTPSSPDQAHWPELFEGQPGYLSVGSNGVATGVAVLGTRVAGSSPTAAEAGEIVDVQVNPWPKNLPYAPLPSGHYTVVSGGTGTGTYLPEAQK